MKVRICFQLVFLFLGIATANAETLHCWDVYTVSLKSNKQYQNPYADIPVTGGTDLLKATFTGTAGKALNRQITITGFWNGGSEWQIHFTPPLSGKWKYVTVSSDAGA